MSAEKSLELDVIQEQMVKYCAFSLSAEKIREEKPTFEPLIIRQNLERLKEALECVRLYDTVPMGGIKDIRHVLEDAHKGRVLTEGEFVDVMALINGISAVMAYEKGLGETKHSALHELFSSLTSHSSLLRLLNSCFNSYGEVKDSASGELREIRNQLRRMDGELAEAARRFKAAHSSSVVDAIMTERNGRMVVLVKASDKNLYGGMVYGDSASGAASYIEPASFVPLNNRKESLQAREADEIHKILVKCSKEVQANAQSLMAEIETLAILDEIFAKAQWGIARDATAAEMSKEKKLVIERARHPLIAREKAVANDYHLAAPHTTLLITGPNTGGKTVSMKIIGLFVLMTYCGMPVTCDHAEIPYFDQVFVDIGDDQSVVSSLSSFSAHMIKQAEICQKATGDSLVLLDEIGSGTDPSEGEALAIAILNDLRKKHCMTVTTTHYNRLKAYGKRHDDILLASVMFDREKLTPTYQYVEGLTGQSNAFEVAGRYGLPERIINYARFLKNQAKSEEDQLIDKLEQQLNDTVARQKELDELIEANKKENEILKKQNHDLSVRKDQILAKAQKEADAYLEETEKKADAILKDMRKNETNMKYHQAVAKKHELNAVSRPEEKPADDIHADYQVGDAVELRANGAVCQIVKIEKKEITVMMNGREVRVKKNQIRPSLHVIPKVKEEPTMAIRRDSIFSSVPAEVNLIGMYVDEAMEELDGYLDQVKVAGLKSCRVIHGDGSGALRRAVHERLARDKAVKSFRLGTPGEGGTGATVVEMK
jgi:DNA mismatch repair protein MutS2